MYKYSGGHKSNWQHQNMSFKEHSIQLLEISGPVPLSCFAAGVPHSVFVVLFTFFRYLLNVCPRVCVLHKSGVSALCFTNDSVLLLLLKYFGFIVVLKLRLYSYNLTFLSVCKLSDVAPTFSLFI